MNVLSIDIGGTSVKMLVTGETERRRFESGPTMTPQLMVDGVKKLTADWKYDVVSIGYPGPVRHDHPVAEPKNLGSGWVGFDFETALGCRVKMINDAACKRWEAIKAAPCSSWVWEQGLAVPWSLRAPSSRWSLLISRSGKGPSKMISANADSKG